MSLFLYRVGGFVCRHARWVVVSWLAVLVLAVLAVGATGRDYDDSFSIPGSPSEAGLNVLTTRFPQAAGASGQIVFTVPEGADVTAEPFASDIEQIVTAVGDVAQVASVGNPVSADTPGVISDDGRSALAQVQFTVPNIDVEQSSLDGVRNAARPPDAAAADGLTSTVGGTAYAPSSEHSNIADIIGIGAAFLVLLVTFRSFLAAAMPLVTAIIGVVVTDCFIGVASTLTSVNSTAPTLALMIGLAVGIDYALFILSRHRRQLAEGVPPDESIARALGTAGSAVVFAGATVIIALFGLGIAGIPFLTVMGVSAAAGVTASVLVSLTLLPAIASLLGLRLTLRVRTHRPSRRTRAKDSAVPRPSTAERWVGLVTRRPVVTIAAVIIGLGVLAFPATSLSLSLADNGSAPTGSDERTTYDAVSSDFGPGYNAPLLVVGNVITSTDPRGDVSAFAADIAELPGVTAVGQATPNPGGDTALVQVIPDGPQSSDETIALVQRLRESAPSLGADHGIEDVQITGQTAVSIDVSQRLAGALVPFGLVVIGLSLILLMIVFRSLVVPIKATVGYVLSIAVSFGVVAAVFGWGWGASVLGVEQTGPVISFLPIIVMGVLFGLAMDYEVFLVSRIREDYSKSGDPHGAIRTGFAASAPVVTAAGLIMVGVFTAFIPTGSTTIKPIALALAVGVFVDAFVVRMTLVPAVLALLGRGAWWLPGWMSRRLPRLDIEGAAVEHAIELQDIAGRSPLVARRLRIDTPALGTAGELAPLGLLVTAGDVAAASGWDVGTQRNLALTLAGRLHPISGELAVAGMLLPEQTQLVQRRVAVFDAAAVEEGEFSVAEYIASRRRDRSWTGRVGARGIDRVLRAVDVLRADVAQLGPGQHVRRSIPADVALAELSRPERFALECALAEQSRVALMVVVGLDEVAASTQRRDIAETAKRFVAATTGVLLLSRDQVRETADLGIADAVVPALADAIPHEGLHDVSPVLDSAREWELHA